MEVDPIVELLELRGLAVLEVGAMVVDDTGMGVGVAVTAASVGGGGGTVVGVGVVGGKGGVVEGGGVGEGAREVDALVPVVEVTVVGIGGCISHMPPGHCPLAAKADVPGHSAG